MRPKTMRSGILSALLGSGTERAPKNEKGPVNLVDDGPEKGQKTLWRRANTWVGLKWAPPKEPEDSSIRAMCHPLNRGREKMSIMVGS
jgi:hypothetical protein